MGLCVKGQVCVPSLTASVEQNMFETCLKPLLDGKMCSWDDAAYTIPEGIVNAVMGVRAGVLIRPCAMLLLDAGAKGAIKEAHG